MEFLCIMVVVFQQCRLSKEMHNWLKNTNFNLVSIFSRTVFNKLFHLHLYFQHSSKLSFRSARHVIEIHEQDCTFIRENFTISFLLSLVECGTHHDHRRCMTQRISFIISTNPCEVEHFVSMSSMLPFWKALRYTRQASENQLRKMYTLCNVNT